MKILIIGGTGNISTPITNELVARGDEVVLYNRGNTQISGARCISGDRYDHAAFEQRMEAEDGFNCIIDMIAYDPEDVESSIKAFKGRTEQYIFCSTVDVYTKPAQSYPIREDAQRKPNPVFSYAFKKAQCELLLEEAHSRGDFKLTIIRPAATYNPWWTPISLLGDGKSLLKRIAAGKPVIVMGDGSSFWTSSINSDVAHAFVGAIKNSKAYGKAYNVTGDQYITWEQYYQATAAAMGAPEVKFVHIPTDVLGNIAPNSASWCVMNFMYNNIFDNSLAKEELGYRYNVTWEEGTSMMVKNNAATIADSSEYPFYDAIIEKWSTMTDSLAADLSPMDV